MTTKEEVKSKVIELLNDIRPHLEKKLDELLNSEEFDFDNESNSWGLPKDIMQALAEEMKFQHINHSATKKDKKRIERFFSIIRSGSF